MNIITPVNKIYNYLYNFKHEYPYIKIVTEDYKKCMKCEEAIQDDEGLYCRHRFCVKNKRK